MNSTSQHIQPIQSGLRDIRRLTARMAPNIEPMCPRDTFELNRKCLQLIKGDVGATIKLTEDPWLATVSQF